MTRPHYLVTIVLYNKFPKDSSSIRSLADIPEQQRAAIRCIVWDNSRHKLPVPQQESLSTMLRGIKYDYRHNKGANIPLSRLYNQSIRELAEEEYLVLLDDDSAFGPDLFAKYSQAIVEHPDMDLFLPIVHCDGKIVSPARMWWFKGSYLRHVTPGVMNCKHITAINSGMVISGQYLRKRFEGYDKDIRFYFTDNDFMSRYTASHQTLYVVDYHMKHTLDFYSRGENFTTKKKRFLELRRSFLRLMKRKGLLAYSLTVVYLFVYSIKFAIQQRDIRYIFLS